VDWKEAHGWLKQAGLPAAAACAVDTALADLAAQAGGVPLAHLLNPYAESGVRCNAALGVLDEGAARRAEAAIASGFEVLKFKVGLAGVSRDLALLRSVAERLPPGVMLRLDANRAWNGKDAACFLDGLGDLPVEMLEEPLRQPDLAALAALQARTEVPLALDESLPELGLGSVLAAAPVRRLVIKPMLLGGLNAGYGLARRAREAGMACVVTTTVDSVVGTLAALHLAAALANGLHHGLATSSWLMRDVGIAPAIRGGILRIDNTPGLGFVPLTGVVP
jgi:o-succinylbenzoate synthase